MLKFCLILSVISSIVGYDYPYVRPTYFYSPHHSIYQPSYQLGPLLHYPSYLQAQGFKETDDQFEQIQQRFFFGSQLSGVFNRGDITGRITVDQNMFLGNSGNNAVFSISLDGGITADSTYAVYVLEDALADTLCGPAPTGDMQTSVWDGNLILASLHLVYSEILGAYDVKRGGISLKGSMLLHNVDGKGTVKGTYPTKGFLNFFNAIYSALVQLNNAASIATGQPVYTYTPATGSTVTGNKISAKGKWVLIQKYNSDYASTVNLADNWATLHSYGCAKLE